MTASANWDLFRVYSTRSELTQPLQFLHVHFTATLANRIDRSHRLKMYRKLIESSKSHQCKYRFCGEWATIFKSIVSGQIDSIEIACANNIMKLIAMKWAMVTKKVGWAACGVCVLRTPQWKWSLHWNWYSGGGHRTPRLGIRVVSIKRYASQMVRHSRLPMPLKLDVHQTIKSLRGAHKCKQTFKRDAIKSNSRTLAHRRASSSSSVGTEMSFKFNAHLNSSSLLVRTNCNHTCVFLPLQRTANHHHN